MVVVGRVEAAGLVVEALLTVVEVEVEGCFLKVRPM